MITTTNIEQITGLVEGLKREHPGGRGEILAAFASLLYSRAATDYFAIFSRAQLAAAAASSLAFFESGTPADFSIRVITPPWLLSQSHGPRTAIQVTGPDQPFLVDTLRELMRARGRKTMELLHPILSVERDAQGRLLSISPAERGGQLVSFISLETDAIESPAAVEELRREAESLFADARRVALDFQAMVGKVYEAVSVLRAGVAESALPERRADVAEAVEFLEWLLRSNFVFLGYREYLIEHHDRFGAVAPPTVGMVKGSGLGILRREERSSMREQRPISELSRPLQRRVLDPRTLTVNKTNAESPVLRRTRMDYVGIKDIDASGNVTRERRFVGLFTSRALGDLPADIPVLKHKLDRILARARVVPGSHDHNEIFSIFCSLPKSELFVTDVEAIETMVLSILSSRDRHEVRVQYRCDELERGVSVLVLIPRHRFSQSVRQAIQQLLARELSGTLVDYRLALTDEPMASLHFYFAKADHHVLPSLPKLERRIAALIRSWGDRLADVLKKRHGVDEGVRLTREYAESFPLAYTAEYRPDEAAADIDAIEAAIRRQGPHVEVSPADARRSETACRLRIVRQGEQYILSRLMPVLSNAGLEVMDESAYRVLTASGKAVYVHRFRVNAAGSRPIAGGQAARDVEDGILHVLRGDVIDDRLNALVLTAGLHWRQVDIVRTYAAYSFQLEAALSQRTAHNALLENPQVARALVVHFESRFDPAVSAAERAKNAEAAAGELEKALDAVPGIVEDQVLRGYANLVGATIRTNYFQHDQAGAPRPALAIKVRSADVTRMPLPRPLYEVFVTGPRVEGIHLRSGKIARGGIRWSERPDDFRTEILGLMKAQRTKNALIVAVGAKGGFILRQTVAPDAIAEEGRRQYQVFIGALLDVTDNVVDGRMVHPPRSVILDDPDPYLVVAADRGTAQFSDVANSIAEQRSFWLGNAFASGGSSGYNHKAYGITARGAWECVRQHFDEIGLDIDSQPFTAAGIGDMSGDVFGNGMVLCRQIRLVAAFNHKHIFVDPDPDAQSSYAERSRLFALEKSSWDDYDTQKISAGGGVYVRSAKSVRLSPQARARLGVEKAEVNGNELVRAILSAKVDLLWNGGIGTYVRATTETNRDVGDATNDSVRVGAPEVGARVIGEGGNLGITQRGRIELARRGVRLNTDFVDNSGGVDLSDHEVNLKILIGVARKRGELGADEGATLLRDVAGEVCAQVVANNRAQSLLLSREERRGVAELEHLRFLMDELETRGLLQREVEHLPADAEITKLREASLGLTRPQLAVLSAYAKIDACAQLLESGVAAGGALDAELHDYFPAAVRARCAASIGEHQLRGEIAATVAVNRCVNRLGITFVHRLAAEHAVSLARVFESYLVASRILDADSFAAEHDAAGRATPVTSLLEATLLHAGSIEALTRWCLRRGHGLGEIVSLRERYVRNLASGAGATADTSAFDALRLSLPRLPPAVLESLSRARGAVDVLESSEVAARSGSTREEVLAAMRLADERLVLDRAREEAARIVRSSASDWRMCALLGAAIDDLRAAWAERVINAALKQGPGVAGRLTAVARELVPDAQPLRRRVRWELDRLRGREPASPSALFVLVEDIRRLAAGG